MEYLRIKTKKIGILRKIFDGLTDLMEDINIRVISENKIEFYEDKEYIPEYLDNLDIYDLRDLCHNDNIIYDDVDNEADIKEKIMNNNKLNLINKKRRYNGMKSININSIDTSQIFLIDIKICNFNELYCKDKIYDMTFNLIELCKLLKAYDKIEDTIKMCIESDNRNIFKILSNKLDSEIRLLNGNYNDSSKLEPNYDCRIEMSYKDFNTIFSNKLMGNQIEIECNNEMVSFCNIDTNIKQKYKFRRNELISLILKSKKIQIKNIYNPKYMNIWGNKDFLGDKVIMFLKQDLPLCIYYDITTDNTSYGYIITYLTPQYDNDIMDTFEDNEIDVIYKNNIK